MTTSVTAAKSDIIKVHCHYATLQAEINYRKRMTWFSNVPGGDNKATVEYQGCHPGVNRLHVNHPFVCTHPDTRRVDDKVQHRQPRDSDVYQSMIHEDSMKAPRDLQQVTSCLFLLHLLRCTIIVLFQRFCSITL